MIKLCSVLLPILSSTARNSTVSDSWTTFAIVLTMVLSLTLGNTSYAHDINVQTYYDTNVVNTPTGNNAVTSAVAEVDINTQNYIFTQPRSALEWQLGLNGRYPIDAPSRAEVSISSGLRYFWQPKLGFNAPWYHVHSGISAAYVNNNQLHNLTAKIEIDRNQRLTDALFLNMRLHYDYQWNNSSVLAGQTASLAALLDWQMLRNYAIYAQLSGGYGWFISAYSGTLAPKAINNSTSSAATRSHHLVDESSSDTLSGDYILDADLSAQYNEDWYSYGAYAVFGNGLIGLNHPINANLSTDIAYRYSLVDNADFQYERQSIYGSLLFNW